MELIDGRIGCNRGARIYILHACTRSSSVGVEKSRVVKPNIGTNRIAIRDWDLRYGNI